MGRAKPGAKPPEQDAQETVEEAVVEQRDLLAEFEKVANELNTILANLEGSTLVKRLKAAARQQYAVAGRLNDHIEDSFGTTVVKPAALVPSNLEQLGRRGRRLQPVPRIENRNVPEPFQKLSQQVDEGTEKISYIMDDMAAYFERRRLVQFKLVLDDMRKQDVLGGLRQLSDDLPTEQGLSMSQCEYWSDTMDRWAEDLVDPACSGACPGGRSKGSLPPSIVLEVLQILEGEINLREETRVAEQAKTAVDAEKHTTEAKRLGTTQETLDGRTVKVVERIRRIARWRRRIRQGDRTLEPGIDRDERCGRHPRQRRYRAAGSRRRNGSNRVTAAIQADQSQRRRWWRGESRRRRQRHHARFRPRTLGGRNESQGSPRRPAYRASGRRNRPGMA